MEEKRKGIKWGVPAIIIVLILIGFITQQTEKKNEASYPTNTPSPTPTSTPSANDCVGAFDDLTEECKQFQLQLAEEYHRNPLNGKVTFGSKALSITNNSGADWNSCNAGIGFGDQVASIIGYRGYQTFFTLLAHKTVSISWQDFLLVDGTPFLYASESRPDSIDIRCDDVGGKKAGSVFNF